MKRRRARPLPYALIAFALAAMLPSVFGQVAYDDGALAREPSWKIPTLSGVRTQITGWLDQREPDAAIRRQAESLWPADETGSPTTTELLERVVGTLVIVHPQSKEIVQLTDNPYDAVTAPKFPWLDDEKLPVFEKNNLRLWFGRWLAQQRQYDDALAQLDKLEPDDVVDPVSLLFYQSVCHHWMLHKKEGLAAIAKLLEQRDALPRRYQHMALLMHADLSELKDDSLDHIARRMNDVTRRLDLGHAGKRIRAVEDGIIESLDKLIKKLEDQASAAQSAGGAGGGSARGIRSISPAQDSRIAKGKGPGEVASKKIGNSSGWGDLPPKEREEALQQLSKEFPSHYRDVIEQYFRKLATESEEK